MPHTHQFLIIGAGIAGMSLASRLVGHRRSVAMLEMEEGAPMHATGRSAALKDPVYVPNADVAALAMASDAIFQSIPDVLTPKASLHLFGKDHLGELVEHNARCRAVGAAVELLETSDVESRFPFLRTGETHCVGALHAPAGISHTLDVHHLYEHFRSRFRLGGGHTLLGDELIRAEYAGGAWTVHTRTRTLRAHVLINCAGAWADMVAARCGLTPLGLVPMKRTVLETTLEPHPLAPHDHGPFVFWNGHELLYADFKPNHRVLLSPADEQVSQPCDAHADEIDLGIAIERLHERTHLSVVHSRGRHWAGLRTFAADRKPVIGWSDEAPFFFWSAAYGGFGIECSPAASALAADLVLGEKHFTELAERHHVHHEHFAPERLHPVLVHRR